MPVNYNNTQLLQQIFPKLKTKPSKRLLQFVYHVSYINFWADWEDWVECIINKKPNFEKLYEHYLKTKLVPYFSQWVVSFVRYPCLFVDSNKSVMLVASETLLRDWQS